ncbi:MAG: molybdopterin-dependent oxidoreductase [Pseudonocardiaceae bacterium]
MSAPGTQTTSADAVIDASKTEKIHIVRDASCTGMNGLIFRQYQLSCLSLFSYLVGDESTGQAVVVDPQRDVSQYLLDAQAHGLRIQRVIETHVHADFLSGHLELAAATGAVISYGSVADTHFAMEPLAHGQELVLGDVVLEIRHTPGHTPESISVVVWQRSSDAAPWGVLTGDTLFIGDVGRPDLLSASGCTAPDLARQLCRSLREQLLTLPDATRVFPAHGAGSSCGKALSDATSSTIGEQRATNYALQPMAEDDFVEVVTQGQSVAPRYFAFAADANRRHHTLLDDREAPVALDIGEVLRLGQDGAAVLDGRAPDAFASGHLTHSLNVGLDGRFAENAGNVVRAGQPIVLVTDAGRETEARVRLARIGFDNVAGYLPTIERALAQRPDLVTSAVRLSATALAAWSAEEPRLQIVDVRNPRELTAGVVPGARHIPLAALINRMDELDPTAPTAIYCASGYRSSIAASALRAAGFPTVADVLGGFGAWSAAGLPAEVSQPADALPLVVSQTSQARHPEEACQPANKHGLIIHSAHPLNCETPLAALIGSAVTSNTNFYVRNHFQTPLLDQGTWRLDVGGLVDRPQALTLRDLHDMSPQTQVITLECAGNGRTATGPLPHGVPWALGAVSTAEWTGVPLVDVLDRAGVWPTAREVIFRGADSGELGGVPGRAGTIRYERSLMLDDAKSPQVLLAYAMNGEPLPVQHGYPVRLVVPGWYGMAAVKWLTEIWVTDEAFAGPYQSGSYHYEWARDGQVVREPVTLQRVRSLITEPLAGEQVDAGELAIRGVAWSGAAPIARVEVSVGGGPWQDGQLRGARDRHHWQRWHVVARVDRGETILRARATDMAGHTQPDAPDWNRWGYGNNAIQKVTVLVT